MTTNASGVKTASALYKAFGETRYSSGALGTDYKFTGQREQAELGLYFYGARWFDPSIGRFTSPDTIVPTGTQGTQAWDRYAYVNNNPVRYTDPTGHNTECGIGESCYGSGPNPNDPPSGGGGSGSGSGSGDNTKNNNHHSCLEDLGDCYMQGWDNFGSAWTIYWNPNATIDQHIVSGLYMGVWITVHVVFVAGVAMLAYGLIVPTGGACAAAEPCRQRVFWSGGEFAQKAADAWAKANNGITIGQTTTGRAISLLDKVLPYQLTKPLWDIASAQFARGASGTSNVFLYLPKYNPSGTWATIEKIALQANPNVTNIIENIVR